MTLLVASEAFADGEHLATKHTCEGSNVSPPLRWNQVPDGTQSLAVVCEDPDAAGGVFTHWVLYDLPGGHAPASGRRHRAAAKKA